MIMTTVIIVYIWARFS